jgi:hypothetical protein
LLTLLLMALLRIKRPEHLSGRGKLQRLVEAAAIAAEIARVRWLSGSALRRRWQAVFGRSPPVHLTAGVMSFARSVSLIPSVPGGRCGVIPGGRAHQGNTDLGADAPAAAYHSFVRFMRIVSQLCSVQVSNEELGTGTVRVLHTLRPFAVAMAGAGEFDPWKD